MTTLTSQDERFRVQGSTAIVTGGSRGIGRCIAATFADQGLDVTICARDEDDLERAAAELDGRSGEVLPVACDVRDEAAVATMVEETTAAFGGVDVLVNNAGATFRCAFDDMSPNAWQSIIDINLTGVFNCTQAAGPALKDGGGSVVNISSLRGLEAAPEQTHYGASKAALTNFTASLAAEWAADGVRVNCIAPGFIATSAGVSTDADDQTVVDRAAIDRRLGAAAEVADAVRFLASPASSFVVGETIPVRGVPTESVAPTGE